MRLRSVVIGFLVIWGVFAAAAFSNCTRTGHSERPPAPEPSLSSSDPGEASQAYWLTARRLARPASGAMLSPEELRRKAGAVTSPADGKRAWAELAQEYARAGAANAEAAKELRPLPRERIDPLAVECVTEMGEFLTLQANLLQKTREQCGEMAALFAAIDAEGDVFDWEGPKGKEYERRESELTARMTETAATEGAAERRRLAELSVKARASAASLGQKYGRDFPDLLGN